MEGFQFLFRQWKKLSEPDYQEFFISYARIWATKMTDEAAQIDILTDPHAPGEARVNVHLANFQEFHEAFNLKASDKMYREPKERIIIW